MSNNSEFFPGVVLGFIFCFVVLATASLHIDRQVETAEKNLEYGHSVCKHYGGVVSYEIGLIANKYHCSNGVSVIGGPYGEVNRES